MKTFIRTTIVIAVLSLAAATLAMVEQSEPAIAISPLSAVGSYSGAGRVLVIPNAEVKGQELLTIMEDLNVMSRILDKKLRDAHLGEDYDWFHGSNFLEWNCPVTKSIYLEGYGALFLEKVDFPLAPPVESEDGKKTKEDFDSVWEQARREIYFREDRWRHEHDERSPKEYDARKVEDLKRTLFEALRHAANIRNRRPDEWVILTIIGEGGASGEFQVIRALSRRYVIRTEDKTTKIEIPLPSDMGLSSPTVMTVRVKKSDVDAFAKGELNLDKFRQKVQIFTY